MQLVVISTGRPVSIEPTDRVLRLVGTPHAAETVPENLIEASEEAAARLRALVPSWMWEFARSSGLATFEVLAGAIGTWWYMPASEMSPQRTRFLRELYWLTLLRSLIRGGQFTGIRWCGDDDAIGPLVTRIADEAGLRIELDIVAVPPRSRLRAVAVLVAVALRDIALWFAVRALRLSPAIEGSDAVLYTRYPVLWESGSTSIRERMYADWPAYLEKRGHKVVYLAAYSGSLSELLGGRRRTAGHVRQQRITFALSLVSLSALLKAHLRLRSILKYRRWRQSAPSIVDYDGFSVGPLLLRDLDRDILDPEIAHDELLSLALSTLTLRDPAIRDVFYPFEFQPTERALTVGAKRIRNCRAIGLQTGLFTSSQFGFLFPASLVRQEPNDASRAPLPDVLAAYGELPYRVFAENLGAERVVLSGPIRYPRLLSEGASATRRPHTGRVAVLVTTSTIREESIPLIEGAFFVAARRPEVALTFRFHYHLPLHGEVRRLSQHHGVEYAISDGSLHDELRRMTAMISGGSSTGIEAIALGCMPLVYRATGRMAPNPMTEVPDAVIFWQTPQELEAALESVIRGDADFENRRNHWPNALRAHLGSGDEDPNECLYRSLYDG